MRRIQLLQGAMLGQESYSNGLEEVGDAVGDEEEEVFFISLM